MSYNLFLMTEDDFWQQKDGMIFTYSSFFADPSTFPLCSSWRCHDSQEQNFRGIGRLQQEEKAGKAHPTLFPDFTAYKPLFQRITTGTGTRLACCPSSRSLKPSCMITMQSPHYESPVPQSQRNMLCTYSQIGMLLIWFVAELQTEPETDTKWEGSWPLLFAVAI